jgi:uncharacterized protein (TIGR00251 family)
MKLSVKVKPNSRKNEVKQLSENSFEVRVCVPPEKGKANEKVIELLSKHLRVPKSRFEIVRGLSSRDKLISVNW